MSHYSWLRIFAIGPGIIIVNYKEIVDLNPADEANSGKGSEWFDKINLCNLQRSQRLMAKLLCLSMNKLEIDNLINDATKEVYTCRKKHDDYRSKTPELLPSKNDIKWVTDYL